MMEPKRTYFQALLIFCPNRVFLGKVLEGKERYYLSSIIAWDSTNFALCTTIWSQSANSFESYFSHGQVGIRSFIRSDHYYSSKRYISSNVYSPRLQLSCMLKNTSKEVLNSDGDHNPPTSPI